MCNIINCDMIPVLFTNVNELVKGLRKKLNRLFHLHDSLMTLKHKLFSFILKLENNSQWQ